MFHPIFINAKQNNSFPVNLFIHSVCLSCQLNMCARRPTYLCMRWTKIPTENQLFSFAITIWHAMKPIHFNAENRRLSMCTYLLKHNTWIYYLSTTEEWKKKEESAIVHCYWFDNVNSIECYARCTHTHRENYMLCGNCK